MAIDYSSLLTEAQKRDILTQRLAQFTSEAYQHTLNKQVAESISNEDGVKAADDALTILDKAIEVHQEELAKLAPVETPAE